VIPGNHDSAARLSAPADLLRGFGVHVVDAVRRGRDGVVAADELLVPLQDRDGKDVALCVAIPFLRTADLGGQVPVPPPNAAPGCDLLPRPGEADAPSTGAVDPVIAGMRALHEAVFARARARLLPGQALVAMAHGYLVGGALSELSERKVLGGNQHALPVDLFPDDCAYVALGHLHQPQAVAGREHVRYCGSPLPLAMPEARYPHQVAFADLAGGRLQKTWVLTTPRPVGFVRLPPHGELEPAAALAAVDALPRRDPAAPEELRPFLEIAVRFSAPAPGIVEQLAARLQDKAARLVRIELVGTGVAGALADAAVGETLARLSPEEVFLRRYARDHRGPVPAALLAAFRELHEQVEHEAGA
jgi:exonuclease SbcD